MSIFLLTSDGDLNNIPFKTLGKLAIEIFITAPMTLPMSMICRKLDGKILTERKKNLTELKKCFAQKNFSIKKSATESNLKTSSKRDEISNYKYLLFAMLGRLSAFIDLNETKREFLKSDNPLYKNPAVWSAFLLYGF